MKKSEQNFKIIEPNITSPLEPLCSGPGPFRPNAAALILRNQGAEILLGERHDSPGAWQWPQGGLDPGESAEAGLGREVEEEIGVADIRILYQFPFCLRYRFPVSLFRKFNPNIGQEQFYFLVELKAEPDLAKAKDKEFKRLTWRPLSSALDSAIWFKREVYRHALAHATEVIGSGSIWR